MKATLTGRIIRKSQYEYDYAPQQPRRMANRMITSNGDVEIAVEDGPVNRQIGSNIGILIGEYQNVEFVIPNDDFDKYTVGTVISLTIDTDLIPSQPQVAVTQPKGTN